jgi:DNA-binding MarR family transcriptional regulator
VQSEKDKRKTLLHLTEKARSLKNDYDSVSDQMNQIYYKGFADDEIMQFENYLNRIRLNLEEWQES